MGETSSSPQQQHLRLDHVYTAAAVNRLNHVADWANTPTSTLAYAAHRSIATWSQPAHAQSRMLTALLHTPFTREITSLKFSAPVAPAHHPILVAGDGAGALATWSNSSQSWTCTAHLRDAHSASISAIGVLRPSQATGQPSSATIVTGASDGLLKVWSPASATSDNQLSLAQTIDLKGRYPLDIAIAQLPSAQHQTALIMAVATTTKKIDLYTSSPDAQTGAPPTFVHKLTLEGHEDWVKSLDFCDTGVDDVIMLASGSQDGSVRLWKIERAEAGAADGETGSTAGRAAPAGDDFEAMVSKIEGDMAKADGEISTKAQHFDLSSSDRWAVTFDALLIGHDNWVTGVRWHPSVPSSSTASAVSQPAALLTSSADNSLILWTPTGTSAAATKSDGQARTSPFPTFDRSLISTGGAQRSRGKSAHHVASSIWLPSQRFGEVGGASNLGFFGALWKPPTAGPGEDDDDFEAVMAHGWGGGTHIWRLAGGSSASLPQWQIASPVTGHFGPATGVAWEPCGEYLLSCSVDQTTRLHAQPGAISPRSGSGPWHEVARPQSHGYDLQSVSWLDRLNFASAADEKVVRVFAAPRGFVGSVGSGGLACASVGTEEESRLNVRPVRGSRYLLALCDADAALPACAARHGDLLRQLAKRACESGGDEASLTAVVVSDKFEGLADADVESPEESAQRRYSFSQLETYLKWMYAQAWAVAVQRRRLFVDINVLLVPSSRLAAVASQLSSFSDVVAVDAASESVLRPSFDNARLPFETVSSAKEGPAQGSGGSSDEQDTRGFRAYRVAALGGTFDHLHSGHKILLSMASLVATSRLVVGVTTDAMLSKKSDAALLESLPVRCSRVASFLRLFRLALCGKDLEKQDVVALTDVAGPAGTDDDVQALVLTDETVSGAEYIDKVRKERNLPPLEHWVIGVLGSEGETDLKGDAKALAESKVGSTAIRRWIREQGARHAAALGQLARARVVQASRVLDALSRPASDAVATAGAGSSDDPTARPVGASVPPLGLSNRAIFSSEGGNEASADPSAQALTSPPTEEQLAVSTLWPEEDKVYGHGYELLSLAAEGRWGRLVASACRASKAEHAVVRVHDRGAKWKEVAVLPGHESSVARIRWSADAKILVSVGKDRTWRAFEMVSSPDDEGEIAFKPFAAARPHARIIWDVSFLPCAPTAVGGYIIATGSRDKTVKLFRLLPGAGDDAPSSEKKGHEDLSTISVGVAVTSLAFSPSSDASRALLAVGGEDGSLRIFSATSPTESSKWTLSGTVQVGAEAINEIAFRPPSFRPPPSLGTGLVEEEEGEEVAVATQDGFEKWVGRENYNLILLDGGDQAMGRNEIRETASRLFELGRRFK